MSLVFNRTLQRILNLYPATNIDSIDVVTSEEGCLTSSFMYSHSIDEVNWSDWLDADSFILSCKVITNTSPALRIYSRILVSIVNKPDVVYSVMQYNAVCIDNIVLNGGSIAIASVEYVVNTRIVQETNTNAVYRPARNVENAKHIREQLSQAVADSISYPGVYFKTSADESSKVITFKSYDVHNYVDQKDIGIILSSSEDYNTDVASYQMFSEYENLEIQIMKKDFHAQFGDDALPSSKDAVWIALFNKMYRVVTAKEERNFMNSAVNYRFYLGKFLKDVSVGDVGSDGSGDEIEEFLDYEQFDLATSMYAKDEIENATTNSDTFEVTHPEYSNQMPNKDSTMISSHAKLLAGDFDLYSNTGLKISDYGYKIEATYDEPLVQYNLASYEESKYTAITWLSLSDLGKQAIKILSIVGSEAAYQEQLYVSKTGFVQVHVNIEQGKYIALQGNPIAKNDKCCLVYSRNISTVNVTLYKFDPANNSLTVWQSASEAMVPVPMTINRKLTIHANAALQVANIRFVKESLNQNNTIKFLYEKQPDAHKCTVIDNCDITMAAIKRSIY